MQPKVSVIIPIYNVEKYLEEALESVINQTLKEIEIILINDGSSDNSLKIVKKYAERDIRIKIFSQVNQGLSIARNKGIEIAKGKYIYFMDSDDYIELNTLEKCYILCEKYNLELVYFEARSFLDGNFYKKINNEVYLKKGKIEENRYMTGIEFIERCISKKTYTVSACLYFFKKETIGNLRFFPKIYYEDDLFSTLLLLKIKKMMFIGEKFYNRRYRENSITTTKITIKHIESRYLIIQELKKILMKKKEKAEKKIVKYLLKNEINSLINISLLGEFKTNFFLNEIILKNSQYIGLKSKIKLRLRKIYILYYLLKN